MCAVDSSDEEISRDEGGGGSLYVRCYIHEEDTVRERRKSVVETKAVGCRQPRDFGGLEGRVDGRG